MNGMRAARESRNRYGTGHGQDETRCARCTRAKREMEKKRRSMVEVEQTGNLGSESKKRQVCWKQIMVDSGQWTGLDRTGEASADGDGHPTGAWMLQRRSSSKRVAANY